MKKSNKFLQIVLCFIALNCEAQWLVLPDRPNPNCSSGGFPSVSIVKPVADNKIIYATSCPYTHGSIGNVFASNDDLTTNQLIFSNAPYASGTTGLINLYVYNDTTFSYCFYVNTLPQAYYTQNSFATQITTGVACAVATAISPNYVYACPGNLLLRSNKMGQQTTCAFNPGYTAVSNKLNFINDSVGFTLARFFSDTSKSTLLKITQYGNAWLPVMIDSVDVIIDYHISDQGTIYVLKKSGAVFKSINKGATFSPLTSAPAGNYICIHFANSMTGFIGGANGVLLKTQDGGTTWTSETSNTMESISSIYTFNNNASYFVDEKNKVYKSQQILGLHSEYDNTKELVVVPNPASHELTLTYNSRTGNPVRSEISDISGRIVMKAEFQNGIKLDVSDLSNGIYIVRIVENNGIEKTQKLLISK